MKNRIWLSPPHMSGHEMQYVQDAFDSNWVAPAGPHLAAFEKSLCEFTGGKHALAVSSGTAALHLALLALGIRKNDVVLCQTLTFCASANPIVYQGAIPVFIDSEPETWNLCPNALEDAILHFIKKRKKPKAIVAVHLYGMPARMDDLLFLSKKYGIPIIEDAAEALGSEYKGRKTGTLGEAGMFSFNGNKIITTSGGGALLSGQEAMISYAGFLASQAKDPAPHYEHSRIGFNYRMSNVCAGIGLGQMEVLGERVRQRRCNFDFYQKNLSDLPGISFQHEPEDSFSNRWLTVLHLDPAIAAVSPVDLLAILSKENIEARPVWKPMHVQPLFSGSGYFGGTVAESLFRNGICLPSGSSLDENDLARITDCIRNAFLNK